MTFKLKPPLSIHVPAKPQLTDEDFGFYLAGLIDGDGHLNSRGQCVICFNLSDISHAYALKKRLGFGGVRKVKDKNAVTLTLGGKKNMQHLVNLISGKLRHCGRIHQLNTRILPFYTFSNPSTLLDQPIDWNSFWFAGFMDADGSLGLRIQQRLRGKTQKVYWEVRMRLQIAQKFDTLLILCKDHFGGYLGKRQSNNTFYFHTVSFLSFYKVLLYFEKYPPQSPRHYLVYLLMRKAYLIIQKNEHVTEAGRQALQEINEKRLKISEEDHQESGEGFAE